MDAARAAHELEQTVVVPARAIAAAFDRHRYLTRLYTKPPATYSAPAPYGAGHCNFTDTEQLGLVATLDHWVRTGDQPTVQSAKANFKAPTGYDDTYYPGPFPLLKK